MASNRARLKRKLRKLLPVVTVTLTASPFAVWAGEAGAALFHAAARLAHGLGGASTARSVARSAPMSWPPR